MDDSWENIFAKLVVGYLIDFKCDHCDQQLTTKENSRFTCNECDIKDYSTDGCHIITSVQCKIKNCKKNVNVDDRTQTGGNLFDVNLFCDLGQKRTCYVWTHRHISPM